ncbi:hypothetical protein G6F46_003737 [Rhizopus delemar]|nr:hypothetical protein G6F55_004078 [Rhizopus delemar]KAG1630917.1 hypothetical protein G6F45_005157 [Rhizopus arrhizus]KAG1498852.1 hypothetical protein G6F54_004790 [Rhizopus delemar]KAG1512605.1 hypothetical protein G6F53_005059 [Rhizopus delemar]KAG1590074.1 hypothetical protein G6F48_004192 [Rhizopus delemar]
MDSTKIEHDSKNLASTQPETTIVQSINYTTINTNREFHNEEKSTYWLPKDEDEQKRLTGQHFAFKELFEGNVLVSVRQNLDFEKGISVLDVGCGSGVWIMDMNNDYPNCTYHGCDIVDTTNKILKIKQFTFSYGNVIEGLPYADNTFDFVNMRFFVYALRKEEWPIAFKEIIRVVKPGGMIQTTEFEFRLPEDTSSAVYKFVNAFMSVAISRGQDAQIALKLESLLSSNGSGSSVAKKLIWDALEITKSAMSYIGPTLGVNSQEDALVFLDDLKYGFTHTEYTFCAKSVSAKKL